MDKQYITIIDNTGRNILGTVFAESETEVNILNPVMITVQPQNGQFQVQLIPLFLAEFITQDEKAGRSFCYSFSKSNIAVGNHFSVDPRIIAQYDKMVQATTSPQTAQQSNQPEVIRLFDEET